MEIFFQSIGATEKTEPNKAESGQLFGPGKWMNHDETYENLKKNGKKQNGTYEFK